MEGGRPGRLGWPCWLPVSKAVSYHGRAAVVEFSWWLCWVLGTTPPWDFLCRWRQRGF